jgi:hypothetical protein
MHADGQWRVYFSFFGGRIGAYVIFPGPCLEDWHRMEIVAPMKSHKWDVSKTKLWVKHNVHINWFDPTRIMPSVKLENFRTGIVAEEKKPRKSKN